MDLTVQLAATQGLVPSSRTVVTKSALGTAKGTLILSMHDEDVGAVLGKKGQTLTSVQQNAKVGGGGW
jgi:RNA-binding protein Nova